MDGHTEVITGGKNVISSGSVIPFEAGETTELFFDYSGFKLLIKMDFEDSEAEGHKDRNFYIPMWDFTQDDDKPNVLSLQFINAAVPMAPGGPTAPIELGNTGDETLFLRIRLFGMSSDRIVIYYTLYSETGVSGDE